MRESICKVLAWFPKKGFISDIFSVIDGLIYKIRALNERIVLTLWG